MSTNKAYQLYKTGQTYLKNKDFSQAISTLLHALELKPHIPDIHHKLALAYEKTRQFHKATKHYLITRELLPHHHTPHYNLGNLYFHQGDYPQAISYFQQALQIHPEHTNSQLNLGLCFVHTDQINQAIQVFNQILTKHPTHVPSLTNLSIIYIQLKQLDSAIKYLSLAKKIQPHHPTTLVNLISCYINTCHWDKLPKLNQHLDQITQTQLQQNSRLTESPFLSIVRKQNARHTFQVVSNWSKQISNSVESTDAFTYSSHKTLPNTINLGYLSSNFRNHVDTHHIGQLLSLHDRSKFRIHCFSFTPPYQQDHYTQTIRQGSDVFIDLYHLSHQEAANLIHSHKVHVLIDLDGYQWQHRLPLFAYQPAPVQLSWLGSDSTLGIDRITHRLADHTIIPPKLHKHFHEKVLYLPHTYLPNSYAHNHSFPSQKPTKPKHDLPHNSIIFSCFASIHKIDQKVFQSWMAILSQTPKSILWLTDTNTTAKQNLLATFKTQGIPPHRLHFAPTLPLESHLNRLRLVDIALDTTIYSSATTTSNALLAGVPVVTTIGNTYSSRTSASVLTTHHLTELIATNHTHYQNIAINLANNPQLLHRIKQKIHHQNLHSPLFDSTKFVRDLESTLLSLLYNHHHNI